MSLMVLLIIAATWLAVLTVVIAMCVLAARADGSDPKRLESPASRPGRTTTPPAPLGTAS